MSVIKIDKDYNCNPHVSYLHHPTLVVITLTSVNSGTMT